MTVTELSIPRVCSQSIQDKAQRLDIVMLTPFVALVEGDHDLYHVWRDTLTCSCQAAERGVYCSHAEAVRLATTPPPPKVRSYAQYNPATGLFDVMRAGVVIGQARHYMEGNYDHA